MVLVLIIAEKEVLLLHTKVDLVVTLGGDGTVLWVCEFNLILSVLDELECVATLDINLWFTV